MLRLEPDEKAEAGLRYTTIPMIRNGIYTYHMKLRRK